MPIPPETLTQRHRRLIATGRLKANPHQAAAIEKLAILNQRLKTYRPTIRRPHVVTGFLGFGRQAAKAAPMLQGVYLFGDVGRGKTALMDMFHQTTAIAPRRRLHFHRFMQDVHERLRRLRADRGGDPIPRLAESLIAETTLLCFDEFDVVDIADAMLLGRLFTALFDLGLIVVATSNRRPDDLYAEGLNRSYFLPFIALLKERLDIVHLGGAIDYRRGRGDRTRYLHPCGPAVAARLEALRARFNLDGAPPLRIALGGGRRLVIPEHRDGVGCASFAALCDRPHGGEDYAMLAEALQTLIILDIPELAPERRNQAARLTTLIDILYDRGVKLIVTAAVAADRIYARGSGAQRFRRTASRLVEMTSE